MGSIIYVIHPVEHSIARSICLEGGSELVVSLDKTFPPGKVVRTVKSSRIQQGENLSYAQVLELLLQAEKVVAL